MTVEEFVRFFPDFQISQDQLTSSRYLQEIGLEFLVDFGFENPNWIICRGQDEQRRDGRHDGS